MTEHFPALATTVDEPDDDLYLKRTLLARGVAARDIARFAVGLIPAIGEEDLPPAFDAGLARRLRALSQRYTVMAVLAARARHATWEEIGKQLGMSAAATARMYGHAERRWRGGDTMPWTPEVHGNAVVTGLDPIDIGVDDIPAVAADLDAFCHRHTQRTGVGFARWARRMVTEGLASTTR